jgi:transcriptional regulator with XRE-family HTH domain
LTLRLKSRFWQRQHGIVGSRGRGHLALLDWQKRILRYSWQIVAGGVVDKILEKLKHEFVTEDARYAYADSIANAFLTAQIKTLQEQRGLTQEELATLVGTQQSGISRWLNSGFSTCKVDTLRKFARAYGVRLWISFEEFGSLPEDVSGFTEKRLAPLKFEDDPTFKEPERKPQDEAAVASFAEFGERISKMQAELQASLNAPMEALNASLAEVSNRFSQIGIEMDKNLDPYWKAIADLPPLRFGVGDLTLASLYDAVYSRKPKQPTEVIDISMYRNPPVKVDPEDDHERRTA